MELRHLRYFVKVAETRHFGRAAEALHMAQPPLSRQIRDLESELGVRLFDRSRRGAELTPAGRVFLREARDVLARAAFAVEQARRAGKGESGELRVGHLSGPGADVIPRAKSLFRSRLPGARLVLSELNAADLAKALAEGEVDAAFVSEPDENGPYGGFPYKAVVRYPLVLAVGAGHRLAARARVRWRDAQGERFWVYAKKAYPDYEGWMMGVCRARGFEPLPAGEVNSSTAMLSAVASEGVALLVPSYACWAPPGVLLKPFAGAAVPAEFGLVWARGATGPLLDAWLETLSEAAKTSPGRLGEAPGEVSPGGRSDKAG